jgi:hypothetical protein
MFISSGRSFTLVILLLFEPFFLLTFTRLFRPGRSFSFLLVLVLVTITSLLILITTSRRLILLLIRWSLIRGGLVLLLILIKRTASNNVGPVDQRRRVFGFRMGDPSMEGFTCGPKVHLHEDARRYVVDIEVGYFEGLNDGRGESIILGWKVVEKNHGTEGLGRLRLA